MYKLMLNAPYTSRLDEKAVWINRFVEKLHGPNTKRNLYLDNENPDFDTFRHAIAQYLGAPLHPLFSLFDYDPQYSSIEAQMMAEMDSGIVRLKPNEDAMDIQVVYDRYGRRTYDEVHGL